MNSRLDSELRSNLLSAGSSAIMLAFAHVHAELWFVALFALVPFLWRLTKIDKRQAAGLGVILATVYVIATSAGELVLAPGLFLLKLAALNTVFALFGYSINRVSLRMGFNPLLIALVWFPLGFILGQVMNLGDVLLVGQTGPELLLGFGSLAGLLFWSAIIVLANGLVLLFARLVRHFLIRRRSLRVPIRRRAFIVCRDFPLSARWALIPGKRAPPVLC